jgi:hypothetical protein
MSNPMVTYVATKKSPASTTATVRSQRRREPLDSATPKRPPIIAPTKNPGLRTPQRGRWRIREHQRRKPGKDDIAHRVGGKDPPKSEDADCINQPGGNGQHNKDPWQRVGSVSS